MKKEDEKPLLDGKEDVNLTFENLCVKKRRRNPFFLLALILLIIAAVFFLIKTAYSREREETAPTVKTESVEVWQGAFDSEEIFSKAQESSVSVIVDGKVCSGFVFSSDGWIATVNGLVNYNTKGRIKVRLSDGRLFEVVAFKESRKAGLALMKIDASDLCAVKFFSGKKLLVGQNIYTFCSLDSGAEASLFSGEISHLERDVAFETENGRKKILSLMQISVLLTQEGVGAPFFNEEGELVGIGCIATDGTDRYIISYAYSAKDVKNLLEKMKNGDVYSDDLFPFVME